ncbi:hypothetical protein K437DRAFT_273641 [Tilletiaria anomala UBC 951]|uniref:RING-type domain-containing protein n=1 Tax=Tilletiaria anomala (strain ATCC 24038 / CBS 436.72 / UBC 951) TaxID=1037660 RepID=A0A066W4R0_TILAU|nr:uncharacterized protein K437DRAFT_273641 [Tilletiaria anomala UBC 951]KDN47538.1 hypothetical protein K437DRAFT_273641 [Tilletiaria anomala UBC 951]
MWKVKRTTLDHFWQQVYRPKFILIVLIALLGWTSLQRASQIRETSSPTPTKALTPGSFIRPPDLSLDAWLHPYVLPPILQLHLLWAVRLLGMITEDHVEAVSLQSETVPKRVLILNVVSCVVGLSSIACFFSALAFRDILESFCVTPTKFETPLLNLRAIVFVECVSTVLGLQALWEKLDFVIPSHVRLPSPSHAPSLAEALGIPRSVSDFLAGQVLVAPELAGSPSHHMDERPTAGVQHGGFPHTPAPDLILQPVSGTQAAAEGTTAGAPLTINGPELALQPQQQWSVALGNSLHFQSPYQADPQRPGKAPNRRGLHVMVETGWLVEAVSALANHLFAAIQYVIVIISLPSLSPTSLPPLLALLALRSELAECTITWTTARSSIECLDFVNHRWAGQRASQQLPDDQYPQTCPICFEQVLCPNASLANVSNEVRKEEQRTRNKGACRLDCGHELHPVCLVSWLGKQAFCPVCHVALSTTPPGAHLRTEAPSSPGP